jgi:hypothetical protein
MKLDSKQMHIVSQLFMAAGKAGHYFDLARFVKEPSYASETMAQLSMHADAKRNDALQVLTGLTMDMLSSITTPAPLGSFSELPALVQAESTAPQKYIGQLR